MTVDKYETGSYITHYTRQIDLQGGDRVKAANQGWDIFSHEVFTFQNAKFLGHNAILCLGDGAVLVLSRFIKKNNNKNNNKKRKKKKGD